MRFFTGPHRYYCGIDLHARTMYLCILEHDSGKVLLHHKLRCEPERFPCAVEPYMKAIHGGKAKNDRIDAHRIATLLRGGAFPVAYVYPRGMRATRDLMRRRLLLVRRRSELFAHIRMTFHRRPP